MPRIHLHGERHVSSTTPRGIGHRLRTERIGVTFGILPDARNKRELESAPSQRLRRPLSDPSIKQLRILTNRTIRVRPATRAGERALSHLEPASRHQRFFQLLEKQPKRHLDLSRAADRMRDRAKPRRRVVKPTFFASHGVGRTTARTTHGCKGPVCSILAGPARNPRINNKGCPVIRGSPQMISGLN